MTPWMRDLLVSQGRLKRPWAYLNGESHPVAFPIEVFEPSINPVYQESDEETLSDDEEEWKMWMDGVMVSSWGNFYDPTGKRRKCYKDKEPGIRIKGTFYTAKRMVAKCFVDNPNEFKYVGYINCKLPESERYHMSNLEWCESSRRAEEILARKRAGNY